MSNAPEQPLDHRGRRVWTPDEFPPPSRVDHTRILAGVPSRAALIVGGLVVVLLSYSIIIPAVMQVILGLAYLLRGRPGTYAEYLSEAAGFRVIEGMLAAHVAIGLLIVVALLATRYLHSRNHRWLSSVQPGLRWRYLLLSVPIAVVILAGMYYISGDFSFPEWNPQPDFVPWIILIVLTSPFQAAGEEYMFRGYLQSVLGAMIPNKWAVVAAASVIFAVLHGTQNLPMFINRMGFGLIAGALIVITGGLEAAIAAHAVNNVLAYGFAASSGGVAAARALTDVTWEITAWNLAGYAVTGLALWGLGRLLNVATRTPYDPSVAV